MFAVGCFSIGKAQIVNIPDANFKLKLLSASPNNGVARDANDVNITVDTNNNGEIEEEEAAIIAKINVINSGISDLTGITSFINLTHLRCNVNNMTSLDVSAMSALVELDCSDNDIVSLLVGSGVKVLACHDNSLTVLNVSSCMQLDRLYCHNNQLTTLDVSNKSELHQLFCFNNLLTDLNISNSSNINNVWCSDNLLTELDLSSAQSLFQLDCYRNQIATLDFSAINLPAGNFFSVNCSENLLTTLDVSVLNTPVVTDCSNNPNLIFINTIGTGTFYDPFANEPPYPGIFFANTPNLVHICADPQNFEYLDNKITVYGYSGVSVDNLCALSNENFTLAPDFTVYPNPVNAMLQIQSKTNIAISSISIYNMLGQVVLVIPNAEQIKSIDVSSLKTGNYFIKINSDSGTLNTRFIKI